MPLIAGDNLPHWATWSTAARSTNCAMKKTGISWIQYIFILIVVRYTRIFK